MRNKCRQMVGKVISDKMDKTLVIEVVRRFMHPLYKKYVSKRVRCHAHEEQNECRVGDVVCIEECKPMSKHTHWRVKNVLERAS